MATTKAGRPVISDEPGRGRRKTPWLPWTGSGTGHGLAPGIVLYLLLGILIAYGGDGYVVSIASLGAINVVLAVGFAIVYSQCGQFSFATFGFYAVGGFTYAWFAGRMPAELAMVAAVAVTALLGYVVRLATVRLNRLYFAIASLAIGALLTIVLVNWPALSGGASGIGPVPVLTFGLVDETDYAGVFLVAWVLSAVAVTVGGLLYRSAWARDLLMVRDLRQIAQNDGIAVRRLELESYTVHAAFTGLAGVLLADTNKFISVASFDVSVALQVLIMVVLGGAGRVIGPVIGAAVITLLPELLRGASTWSGVVYGLLMLVVLVALPEGVLGLWDRLKAWLRPRFGGGEVAR
ncbi:ABC-type branched-subunit amino acid transport system permease subunit [Streptosporangium album]|uniref:ABC-type branched-subunit amino acid transport system permease subunit n=1 Tax=Streptosporangium album TaxID=47479 RepID=A0A7W7WDZ0_9ACTN|nr:branched-chain amino acid ABC transporter permease [Streptosporangium album]MBB4944187.1 ABC-type branched-subunit amino acid transport system permease subunit [Streptosporangium album]